MSHPSFTHSAGFPFSYRIEFKISLLIHQCITTPLPTSKNYSHHKPHHITSSSENKVLLLLGPSSAPWRIGLSAQPLLACGVPLTDHPRAPQSTASFNTAFPTHPHPSAQQAANQITCSLSHLLFTGVCLRSLMGGGGRGTGAATVIGGKQISGQSCQGRVETDPKSHKTGGRGDELQEREGRTIMMSPDARALEDLLYAGDLGDEGEGAEGAEPGGRAPAGTEESAASDNEPMTCAGCGEQVCDRFFLLAAGCVWHGVCLRCSQCHCELQTHPSLYWRNGHIYCQQDYCRMFGGGQCARCLQPIPASALVMRSGDLTFHPHCFSCQECDVTLIPGNLYCMQGQNLYCQSHYHGDDLQPKPSLKEAQNQVSGEGEESVSSPEPRLDDRATGGRSRRRSKRIRTCFRSEQLRALESYFAEKHNPDGKDWNCLAHKTGLPKRVLQVWFQNARAKLRRSLTADDSQANSPSAPQGSVTVATGSPSPSPSCSPPTNHSPSLLTPAPSTSCSSLCSPPRSPRRRRARPPASRFSCEAPLSSWTTTPRVHQGASPLWRPSRTSESQEEERREMLILIVLIDRITAEQLSLVLEFSLLWIVMEYSN
ncbi:uncharacterized protein LOC114568524 [Perca flavescens]|uniref:uncharacterized protein LOC114568524 n=1 Tax=Perca flavescens TaxID=8167 RepID=UPI00106E919E|nr:uncharacterized protein LOC114568524 [Perca flavescens]